MATELAIYSALAEAGQESAGYEHLLYPLDSFEEQGPNGTHRVLVYIPMGGTVTHMAARVARTSGGRGTEPFRYPMWLAKRILKHTLLGLDCLHGRGIVHGDLHPGSLLFSVRGLNEVEEANLRQDAKEASRPLVRKDGKADIWAPRYLVLWEQVTRFVDLGREAHVRISEFGSGGCRQALPGTVLSSMC